MSCCRTTFVLVLALLSIAAKRKPDPLQPGDSCGLQAPAVMKPTGKGRPHKLAKGIAKNRAQVRADSDEGFVPFARLMKICKPMLAPAASRCARSLCTSSSTVRGDDAQHALAPSRTPRTPRWFGDLRALGSGNAGTRPGRASLLRLAAPSS